MAVLLDFVQITLDGHFTVRLTVSVDPPAPLRSAFRDCFGVLLTLYCDYICSETDFTQENKRIGVGVGPL